MRQRFWKWLRDYASKKCPPETTSLYYSQGSGLQVQHYDGSRNTITGGFFLNS